MPFIEIDPGAVPGLREAEAKEHAFRAIPVFTDRVPLFGEWVHILTPRLHAELHFARNPIVCGGLISFESLLHFAWRLHPDYVERGCGLRHFWRLLTRARLRRRIAKAGLHEAIKDVMEYVDFVTSSAVSSGASSAGGEQARPVVHPAIENAAFMQAEMGMPIREYLDTPLPILHQLYRAYLVRNGARARIWQESDQLYNQYATELLNPWAKSRVRLL